MADTEETTEELDRRDRQFRKVMQIIDMALCIALVGWQLWELKKDDPLTLLPVKRAVQWTKRRRLERKANRIELAKHRIDVDLFIDREVQEWAK